jgi:hypothetical protein
LISFRYHLVSIVAVFLALALGVVMGTTVIKQGVVDQLRTRTNNAVQTTHRLQNQVNQLQSELGTWQTFGDAAQGMLVSNTLNGRDVVMVTVDGVDPAEVDGVRRALEQAGARVVSLIVVTSRMSLADQSARTDLATILGASPTASAGALTTRAAQALGTRLSNEPPVGDADFLQQLVAGRFLALRGGSGPVQSVGAPDQAVVFLSGGTQSPPVDMKGFLIPVVSQLVTANRQVVAAETFASAYPFVPLVRSDGSLDNRLVTVDDADTLWGRVALVLGLRDLLLTPGRGGDYGLKSGATALIPKS